MLAYLPDKEARTGDRNVKTTTSDLIHGKVNVGK